MKAIFSAVLTLSLLFSLSACGGEAASSDAPASDSLSVQQVSSLGSTGPSTDWTNNDIVAQLPALPSATWAGESVNEAACMLQTYSLSYEEVVAYAQRLQDAGFTAAQTVDESMSPLAYSFHGENAQGCTVTLAFDVPYHFNDQGACRLTVARAA